MKYILSVIDKVQLKVTKMVPIKMTTEAITTATAVAATATSTAPTTTVTVNDGHNHLLQLKVKYTVSLIVTETVSEK